MNESKKNKKEAPTWSDVKTKLAGFDRSGVVALLQDLYSYSKENQAFLHARFSLDSDTLKPYKSSIARWIRPDIARGQDMSIAKAKKAVADYKKAVGRPDEMAELTTFYCEQAVGFCREVGFSDERLFVSLMGMFIQALKLSMTLAPVPRSNLRVRLTEVSRLCVDFGYGLSDEMDELLEDYSTLE